MSWDKTWDHIFQTNGWGKYPPEELVRFTARAFCNSSDRSKIKILEVGCGPGPNLWYLAREGFEVYGIDGSATAVKAAKTRLDSEMPDWKGKIVVGDFCELPFKEETFDAVIDVESIYCNNMEDSHIIVKEIIRVLKPKGLFFSKTFSVGTYGENTGQSVGPKEWKCELGPLAGKGLARFTDEDDIATLYGLGNIVYIELHSRSLGHPKDGKFIKEWVIVSEK